MKGLTTICIEELVLALFQEELSLEEEFVPIEIITQLFHTAHVSGLISDYILENLIRDNITTITLRACMSLRDSGVRIIAERLPMLEVVDFNHCCLLTNPAVSSILECCIHLKTLNVSGCFQISDEGFTEGCTQDQSLAMLQHLDVSETGVSSKLLELLSIRSANLLCINISSTTFEEASFLKMIQRCTKIHTLKVENCKFITTATIREIAKSCSELRALDLSGCYRVKDSSVLELSERCSKLEYLSLLSCNQITDDGLLALAKNSLLSKLNLSWTSIKRSFDDLGSSPMASTLKDLNVAWCTLIPDDVFCSAILKFKNLTVLDLSWKQIPDRTLGKILKHCNMLESLDITGCTALTAQGFAKFEKRRLPRIQRLSFAFCRGLLDEELLKICQSCPNLTYIDISLCSNISNKGLESLKYCELLSHISMNRCRQFSDEGFEFIRHCRKLKSFFIAEVSISDFKLCEVFQTNPGILALSLPGCRHITELTTDGVVSHLNNLKILILNGCSMIQDYGVSLLVDRFHNTLHSLSLSETGITDHSVELIARKCRNLVSLTLSYCIELSDQSIVYLATHCKTLLILDIATCKVSPDSVIELLVSIPTIRNLSLSGCKLMNNCVLCAISLYCTYMEKLCIFNCPEILDHEIAEFQQQNPKIALTA